MTSLMTCHARVRLQQRGIPPVVLTSLLDFGCESHDHRGSCIVFFDHRARNRLRLEWGEKTYKQLEPHLDAYAVIGSDGVVVTVGHRTHHINRN